MQAAAHVTDRETIVPENEFIYSQTDTKGRITQANQVFADLCGYTVEEMIGKPHNIIRHPDMPKEAFADMWKSLKEGRPWQGFVKNRRKDGGFYWVQATVSPVRGQGGTVTGFQSLRRRAQREQIKAVEEAYRRVRNGDRSLRIEDGRAVDNLSALRRQLGRVDLRIALAAVCGLGSAAAGLGLEFGGAGIALLRTVGLAAFVLGGLSALLVLLHTLPNLTGDLDCMDQYLDRLLRTGDFTATMERNMRGRSAKVAHKLALLAGWIQATITCIQDAVETVEEETTAVRKAVEEIEEAVVTQNMATSSVAAATSELDLTTREVSEHLQTTAGAVEETGRKAVEGAAVSHRASNQVQELATVVKDAAVEVEALGQSSSEIQAIAGVIREIADQTNLLALNASIEAARAGEAGRGFSVVANEVRSLADRTMKATAKINTLIETIRGDSDRAIAGMRAGATQVAGGVALVQEANGALNGINDLMSAAVRRVSEIASASGQQTEAINEININITKVAAMTERNAGVVKQTSHRMGELAPLLDRVKQAVVQFHA